MIQESGGNCDKEPGKGDKVPGNCDKAPASSETDGGGGGGSKDYDDTAPNSDVKDSDEA